LNFVQAFARWESEMKKLSLQQAVCKVLELELPEQTLTLTFPLAAVAEAEAAIGKSLKSFEEWLKIEPKDLPALVAAGLKTHHADFPRDQVEAFFGKLTPEACIDLHYALVELAFPRAMGILEEHRAKKLAQGASGEPPQGGSPNA
jgi:hypothetical protein